MNIKPLSTLFAATLVAAAIAGLTSCDKKRFRIEGTITGAADSTLYLENMGLDGAVAIDSARLSADGSFSFEGDAPTAPEFYRLRIGGQFINIAIDSTESVSVKAEYPGMAARYEVSGSDECQRIKDLSAMQMALQAQVNAIAADPTLGAEAVNDSVARVLESYKNRIKTDYIFKAPMRASSYFALFQTLYAGQQPVLIFNPRTSEQDIKVFAAVATSWDTFYPKAKRGENLHNIALEGMKDVRYMRSKRIEAEEVGAARVNDTGILDFALTDNHGAVRQLSALKGKVVLLDFHMFADEGSMKRIMTLRELYNRYHARGLEIYQVSVDGDEHFWKMQTAALPWISTRVDDQTQGVLQLYNVQQVPTFFLLDRNCNVHKRDAQIKDIDTEIQSLL